MQQTFNTVEAAARAGVPMVKCAEENCHRPKKFGKSKYCADHALTARRRWLDNIEQGRRVRQQRVADFERIFAAAHMAGHAAATDCQPRPMIVSPGDITVNSVPVSQNTYYVGEGACGFAWVTLRPGNSPEANYAKKNLGWRRAYHGGVEKWISDYGQSVARKESYAQAFADVLSKAGFSAYAGSRLD